MNYGSLRRYLNLRYYKAADDGGASGGGSVSSPSSGSDTGTASPGGDGGGGSSVAPTPSDGGVAPTPSSPDPWANLGSSEDLDHIEIPAAPPPQATPTPAQPTPQAAPAQPQPAAPPQQPQVPPQPTAAQPQGQTPSAPPSESAQPLSPSDPAGMAAAMEQNAATLIQHLAQERFQLTPEEVQELETDVTAAVPKLLAKVHLQSQIAMQRFLAQAVPGMIQRHAQVSRANSDAEDKFFETHKALGLDKSNQQHRETAVRAAKLYRQMYPQASLDQLISDIGPMVAMNLKLNPGAAPQPQAQPGSPVVMHGGTPFRPAVNGGGGAIPSTPAQTGDEWSGLGQNYD